MGGNDKSERGCVMIRFRMFKINVEQFAIFVEDMPQGQDAFSLETRLQFKISDEHKIAPVARFLFANKNQPILVIEVCCEFDIHPEDWKAMLKGTVVTIPKETLSYLAAQTVGVARGVLYCKTEGTPFWALILPPINVASMISEDISMEIL